MSVLDVLDATRICSRWSESLADPAAWAVAAPMPVRREPPAVTPGRYSWWSLSRNPRALLLAGVITAGLLRDTLVQALAEDRRGAAG